VHTGATVVLVRGGGTVRSVGLKTASGAEREPACGAILVAAGRLTATAGLSLAAAGYGPAGAASVACDCQVLPLPTGPRAFVSRDTRGFGPRAHGPQPAACRGDGSSPGRCARNGPAVHSARSHVRGGERGGAAGEASTLGQASRSLGEVRAEELRAAAAVLGAQRAELLSYPDGNLAGVPEGELAELAGDALTDADLLLVFDQGGITGHPDHCRGTAAALLAACGHQLPVLGWALPEDVAAQLNAEFGTTFAGRPQSGLHIVVDVDRARQRSAIACHASQSGDNPVLWGRLELLGASEHLRWLT
jgi:LmbE family N-acetylglucosaminyl deacetylase